MGWSEAKWTVDNILQKLGRSPNNMRKFVAYSVSATSVGLTFLEPSDSYDSGGNIVSTVGGVVVRMSDQGYPADPNEGQLVLDNRSLGAYSTSPFIVEGLTKGKKYYFSAFPYSSQGVYNLSSNTANRAEATPADGETVTVTINIDDNTSFTSAKVTCIDETDGSRSQSAMVSKSRKVVSFVVPIGHMYHIEFEAPQGYSTPSKTKSKKSVAGETSSYTGNYYYFTSNISVTYPQGAVCTCECGDIKYTAPDTSGRVVFPVHKAGTWTMTAISGNSKDTKTILVSRSGQTLSLELSFIKVYGISRDITLSSPEWARTGSAVGMKTKASVGTVAGFSDFDNVMPWKGIVREKVVTGDFMVKIPKFYYRRYRTGNIEHIEISDTNAKGLSVHPLFINKKRQEVDYVYIGAYLSHMPEYDSKSYSKPKQEPETYDLREKCLQAARAKGEGWGIVNINAWSAIQMLYLVEYANYNSQLMIGKGVSDYISNYVTGTCDNVPRLTGSPVGEDGKTDVVWRGIETLWGFEPLQLDNIQRDSSGRYCRIVNGSWTNLSYTMISKDGGYITELGLDEKQPHIMLPVSCNKGSESTFMCDGTGVWFTSGTEILAGNNATYKGECGLFSITARPTDRGVTDRRTTRLLYIP